ncbi:MAG: hypothetical protein ACP5VN_10165, partial [Acidobacteriota bacterium]
REWYKKEKDEWVKVSYNDLSLVYGGLYDIDRDHRWDCPHALHRVGTSVDVNHGQTGSTEDVHDDQLDKIAERPGIGLTRYEKRIGKIHYELR